MHHKPSSSNTLMSKFLIRNLEREQNQIVINKISFYSLETCKLVISCYVYMYVSMFLLLKHNIPLDRFFKKRKFDFLLFLCHSTSWIIFVFEVSQVVAFAFFYFSMYSVEGLIAFTSFIDHLAFSMKLKTLGQGAVFKLERC